MNSDGRSSGFPRKHQGKDLRGYTNNEISSNRLRGAKKIIGTQEFQVQNDEEQHIQNTSRLSYQQVYYQSPNSQSYRRGNNLHRKQLSSDLKPLPYRHDSRVNRNPQSLSKQTKQGLSQQQQTTHQNLQRINSYPSESESNVQLTTQNKQDMSQLANTQRMAQHLRQCCSVIEELKEKNQLLVQEGEENIQKFEEYMKQLQLQQIGKINQTQAYIQEILKEGQVSKQQNARLQNQLAENRQQQASRQQIHQSQVTKLANKYEQAICRLQDQKEKLKQSLIIKNKQILQVKLQLDKNQLQTLLDVNRNLQKQVVQLQSSLQEKQRQNTNILLELHESEHNLQISRVRENGLEDNLTSLRLLIAEKDKLVHQMNRKLTLYDSHLCYPALARQADSHVFQQQDPTENENQPLSQIKIIKFETPQNDKLPKRQQKPIKQKEEQQPKPQSSIRQQGNPNEDNQQMLILVQKYKRELQRLVREKSSCSLEEMHDGYCTSRAASSRQYAAQQGYARRSRDSQLYKRQQKVIQNLNNIIALLERHTSQFQQGFQGLKEQNSELRQHSQTLQTQLQRSQEQKHASSLQIQQLLRMSEHKQMSTRHQSKIRLEQKERLNRQLLDRKQLLEKATSQVRSKVRQLQEISSILLRKQRQIMGLQQRITASQRESNVKLDRVTWQNSNLVRQNQFKYRQIANLQAAIAQLKARDAALSQQKINLRQQLNQKMSHLKCLQIQLVNKQKSMQQMHSNRIKSMDQNRQNQLKNLTQNQQNQLKSLNQKYQNQLKSLNIQVNSKQKSATQEQKSQLKILQIKHHNNQNSITQKYQNQLKSLQIQLATKQKSMTQMHQNQLKSLQIEHHNKQKSITQKHQNNLKIVMTKHQLQNRDIQVYKNTLKKLQDTVSSLNEKTKTLQSKLRKPFESKLDTQTSLQTKQKSTNIKNHWRSQVMQNDELILSRFFQQSTDIDLNHPANLLRKLSQLEQVSIYLCKNMEQLERAFQYQARSSRQQGPIGNKQNLMQLCQKVKKSIEKSLRLTREQKQSYNRLFDRALYSSSWVQSRDVVPQNRHLADQSFVTSVKVNSQFPSSEVKYNHMQQTSPQSYQPPTFRRELALELSPSRIEQRQYNYQEDSLYKQPGQYSYVNLRQGNGVKYKESQHLRSPSQFCCINNKNEQKREVSKSRTMLNRSRSDDNLVKTFGVKLVFQKKQNVHFKQNRTHTTIQASDKIQLSNQPYKKPIMFRVKQKKYDNSSNNQPSQSSSRKHQYDPMNPVNIKFHRRN